MKTAESIYDANKPAYWDKWSRLPSDIKGKLGAMIEDARADALAEGKGETPDADEERGRAEYERWRNGSPAFPELDKSTLTMQQMWTAYAKTVERPMRTPGERLHAAYCEVTAGGTPWNEVSKDRRETYEKVATALSIQPAP